MMPSAFVIAPLVVLTACSSSRAFSNVVRRPAPAERRRLDTKLDVEPAAIAAGAVAAAGAATLWLSGADDRAKRSEYAEREAEGRAREEERERLAYIEPREAWKEEELRAYDGTSDEHGPLLMAVKGDVFNVWRGRHFYGPDGEYRIMAGRDSTRFLAKNRLEEESDDERAVELNIAERANLEAWYWTIKNKYQIVGKLEGYDSKSTEM